MVSNLLQFFKNILNIFPKKIIILLIIIFLLFLYKLINIVITNDIFVPESRYELEMLIQNKNIPLGSIDIRNIDNLSRLFYLYPRKDYSGIEKWDVSHVKDMTDMFCSVDSENIPSWYMAEKWEEYETLITIESKAED